MAKYDQDTLKPIQTVPSQQVPWITVDPLQPDLAQCPLYQHASPMIVHVRAGDILYLPAFWFHHVQQKGARVVAVNWWFDVQDGWKWWRWQTIQHIQKSILFNEITKVV